MDKFTEEDKKFISLLKPEWKWVARDWNNDLYLYKTKPTKGEKVWITNTTDEFCRLMFGSYFKDIYSLDWDNLFCNIDWEDEEPTIINSLLDKKEKYFIKHYILNNPCFRKMKVNFIRKCLYNAHNGGMCLEVEFDNHDFSHTNIPVPDGMFENLKLGIMYSVDKILI